jgi:hypothetical protein
VGYVHYLKSWPSYSENVQHADMGIDFRYPLLDKDIIEACLAIPTAYKTSSVQDRLLIRNVARPVLPSDIVHREDKGPISPDYEVRLRQAIHGIETVVRCAERDEIAADVIDFEAVKTATKTFSGSSLGEIPVGRLIQEISRPYNLLKFIQLQQGSQAW